MKISRLLLLTLFTFPAFGSMTFTVEVDPVTYQVDLYGQLDDTCDGLAFFSVDLALTGAQDVTLGNVLTLTAPTAMASFDTSLGVSNPSDTVGISAYGGTADGATLRQIGGGQNTLANIDPPVAPTGTVVEGIATGTEPQLLATGTLNVTNLTRGDYTFTLSNAYVLILDEGQAGPDYTVSRVNDVTYTNGSFVVQGDVSTVNSMANHGATEGDLGVQIYPPELIFTFPSNCEPRIFSTGDAYWLEIALSQAIPADVSDITVTATDAFDFSQSATVSLNAAGDLITAVFDPYLPDQKIYTIDVASAYINDMNFEYAMLAGNTVSLFGVHRVESTDRSVLSSHLGDTASVAGARYDIYRVGASAGLVQLADSTEVDNRMGNSAQRLVSAVSMANHGATEGDLGIQVWPIPTGSTIGSCEPRILTEHKLALTFDGVVEMPAVALTVEAEDSSGTVTLATVTTSGRTAEAVFNPALTDQKIYTITVGGVATGSFEYVVLAGNAYNVGTSLNTVDLEDETQFTGRRNHLPSVDGPQWDLSTNGVIYFEDQDEAMMRSGNSAS